MVIGEYGEEKWLEIMCVVLYITKLCSVTFWTGGPNTVHLIKHFPSLDKNLEYSWKEARI